MKKHAISFGVKEKVLNYTSSTYQLTRPNKVGPVMELIRQCQPTCFEDWEAYFYSNSFTTAKARIKVTPEVLNELGVRLFEKITSVVIPEWTAAFSDITVEDCKEYIKQVTLQRTFDGYHREKSVIHDNLENEFPDVVFEESDSELDHAGDIDYLGKVGHYAFGIQIKPITATASVRGFNISARMRKSFEEFEAKYKGKVFIVFSEKEKIMNAGILNEIRVEIQRLEQLT